MISIVIPFYKNYDTIENLLRSINDQDYKEYDIIVVQDGLDDKIDGKALSGKHGCRWVVRDTNEGASKARNYGASLTSGDILFFIDADCLLYPGMLRECSNQLELNPDIDFVYGNYRFESKHDFISNGFDPYLLETMNYIPTMSPVRRTAFDSVGGFTDLAFFQDWSLFYRMVQKGSKGKYIKDFIFTTKIPTEESISGSQGMSLDEKASKFRHTHGIKDKTLVVTTHAAPLQAINRAEMLNADYVGCSKDSARANFPINYGFSNWKATYMVGVFNEPIKALENHLNVVVGKPIYHFIGTDVYQLLNHHPISELKYISRIFKSQKAKIFANSPRLVKELKEAYIKAELLYTPIYNMTQYKVRKLPKNFTVGVYCSDTTNMNGLDGVMSHLPMIQEIALAMPDIQFKFFGSKMIEKTNNIELCGRIPEDKMVKFINSCSMVLRATYHDGFPQLPIQFLLCGRQALVSCPDKELKYMEKLSFEETAQSNYDEKHFKIPDYEQAKNEVISKIYSIIDNPVDASILSKQAHKYYGELMSVKKFKEAIYKYV